MRRLAIFTYSIVCYAVFLAVALYAIGFIGNFLVPTSLDGPRQVPLVQGLLVDIGLLALFALQHSGMARQGFKRWWTRMIPVESERSTYVLLSSVALGLFFWFWQPLGGELWAVEAGAGHAAIMTVYFAGWALVFYSTFLIDHFDLFGLKQGWYALGNRSYHHPVFHTPGPYKVVRHPLYVGWLTVFWAAPVMTAAHLLFAVATTAYILIAIQLEERDLTQFHGQDYSDYRRRVPMLIPALRPRYREPAADRS